MLRTTVGRTYHVDLPDTLQLSAFAFGRQAGPPRPVGFLFVHVEYSVRNKIYNHPMRYDIRCYSTGMLARLPLPLPVNPRGSVVPLHVLHVPR